MRSTKVTTSVSASAVIVLTLSLGCASSTLGRSLNVGVVGSASADYLSTRRGEARGAHEANPIMGNGALGQALMKVLGTSVVIGLAHEMDNKHGILADVIRGAAITCWSLAAIHNSRVIR